MAEWVAVCRLDELREGRGVSLDAAGLAASRSSATAPRWSPSRAVARMPDGSLGHGWIEEGEVVCPLHRWRFRLADGRCTTVRGKGVHRFRCEVRGEEVWVEV